MDPVTVAAALFVLSNMGSHYLEKIFDGVDKVVIDKLGRGNESFDPFDVAEVLNGYPEAVEKVEEVVRNKGFLGLVLPPVSGKPTIDTKLDLFCAVLNSILTASVSLKRDLAVEGFLNGPEMVSFFETHRANDPKLVVKNRQISFPHYVPFRVSVFHPHAAPVSPEEGNTAICGRKEVRGKDQYVRFRDVNITLSDKNVIYRLTVKHLIFGMRHYEEIRTSPIVNLDRINDLSGPEKELHLLKDPYLGIEKMIRSLQKEFQREFLSENEASEIRRLVECFSQSK